MARRDWDSVNRRDRKVVEGCLAGDEAAWMELWERYGPMVKAVARRAGCTAEESDDVLQRVALVALESLDGLRDPGRLAGWLAGVARFQALALVRERRRSTELDPAMSAPPERFHERLEAEQELAILRKAMLSLEDRCRRIVRALYLDDPPASYREVAEREGLSATSIGPIRGRCLARLKKVILELSRSGFREH